MRKSRTWSRRRLRRNRENQASAGEFGIEIVEQTGGMCSVNANSGTTAQVKATINECVDTFVFEEKESFACGPTSDENAERCNHHEM